MASRPNSTSNIVIIGHLDGISRCTRLGLEIGAQGAISPGGEEDEPAAGHVGLYTGDYSPVRKRELQQFRSSNLRLIGWTHKPRCCRVAWSHLLPSRGICDP